MRIKAKFVALSTTKSNFSFSLFAFFLLHISTAFPPAPPPLHFYSFPSFLIAVEILFSEL